MGPYNVIVAGLLAIALAMAIVIYFPTCCKISRYEGFETQTQDTLLQCPKGTKAYTDLLGSTNCCEGTVSGNHCEGSIKCTLSSSKNNVPTCISLHQSYLRSMDGNCKWPKMPHYFENEQGSFCASTRNTLGTKSATPQKTCQLFDGPKTCSVPSWWRTEAPIDMEQYNNEITSTMTLEQKVQVLKKLCEKDGNCFDADPKNPKCYRAESIDANKFAPSSCYKQMEDEMFSSILTKDGLAMEIVGGNMQNGAIVNFTQNKKALTQQWVFQNDMIKSRYNGKNLDILGFNYNHGAVVGVWDETGGENQRFFRDGEGYIRSKKVPMMAICPNPQNGNRLELLNLDFVKGPILQKLLGSDYCKLNITSV